MGLATHSMGGFDKDKAFEVTGFSKDEYDVCCMTAVGYRGTVESLPDHFKEKESILASKRKDLSAITKEFK
jgi:hypothetical protein